MLSSTPAKKFHEITDGACLPATGASPIHYWAATDDIDKIISLTSILLTSDLLVTDHLGNTILHYAASHSSYKVAEFLMTLFYDTHFFNHRYLTPAHLAAQRGDTKMLQILSKSRHMLSDTTPNHMSPIHLAVVFDHVESAEYLATPSQVNLCCPLPPLDLCRSGEMRALLESKGALPSLHAAVATHDLPAISRFLLNQKDLNRQATIHKLTPLHIAASLGYEQACSALLEGGCLIDVVDADGFSPLDLAVVADSLASVRLLAGRSTNEQISKAAFLAADLGRSDITHELVRRTDSSIVSADGDSILIRLIKRGLIKVAIAVIDRITNFTFKDARGATALHYSAAVHSPELLDLVLASTPDPGPDLVGHTPLMYAVFAEDADAFKLLEKKIKDTTDKFGLSAHVAAFVFGLNKGKTKIFNSKYSIDVRGLISSREQIRVTTKAPRYGKNPSSEIRCRVMQLTSPHILKTLKNINQRQFDKIRKGTIMHIAIVFNAPVSLLSIIFSQKKELIDDPDGHGQTPLFYAVKQGNRESADFLIKYNANVQTLGKRKSSVLFYVQSDSMIETAEILYSNSTISPGIVNGNGQTVFHIVCKNGAVNLLKLHISKLDDKSLLSKPDKNGLTPLDMAVQINQAQCAALLYAAGVEDPVATAVLKKDAEKVKQLVSLNYPVCAGDPNKKTPLHIASEINSLDLVKLLLGFGADPSVQTTSGFLPLHYAAQNNSRDVSVELIRLSKGFSSLTPKGQPFLLSKDIECRRFLHHYWRRQIALMSLFSFIVGQLPILNDVVSLLGRLTQKLSKVNVSLPMSSQTISLVSDIKFASNMIIKQIEGYDVSKSTHHILMPLLTIDIASFCQALVQGIVTLSEIPSLVPGNEYSEHQAFSAVLVPLRWIVSVNHILRQLKEFQCSCLDDGSLLTRVTSEFNVQNEEAVTSLERIRALFTMALSKTLGVESIAPINDNPVVCSQGVVDDIQQNRVVYFDVSLYHTLKEHFGQNFALPRVIPFRNRQKVKVCLLTKFLIFCGDSKELVLPLSLVSLRGVATEKVVMVTTPIGSFRISMGEGFNTFMPLFENVSLLYTEGFWGDSRLMNPKNKFFSCVVAYQASGTRYLSLKLMKVKAGKAGECHDICYDQIADASPSPPVSFSVHSIELKDNSDEVIFC